MQPKMSKLIWSFFSNLNCCSKPNLLISGFIDAAKTMLFFSKFFRTKPGSQHTSLNIYGEICKSNFGVHLSVLLLLSILKSPVR